MGKLDGKVALITGGARGIGAAAARIFVQEGARLMLVDMLEEPLKALTAELGDAAAYSVADVSSEQDVKRVVDDTVGRYGKVDVALLNAGINTQLKPIEELSAEYFDKVMAVNVRGVWLGLKFLMKAMTAHGGSIVVTSSAGGIRATPNLSAYIASKHAAIGLMRAAAVEGAARGIRVNSVNPATVDTPMVQALRSGQAGGSATPEAMARNIPLGRQGTAEEVAQMMLFLASDDSSFCTGGVYMVDGGATAGRAY